MVWAIAIKANTIDAAAGEILGILDGISKHERNIYFDGWCALGASAALRVAAQRLKSLAAKGRKFDKVVHVDCTLWQSMRALQKAVAEELELPQSVMAIFDQYDEEDDFNGIDQGSRGILFDVREEIFRKLASSTFVVFFHNGSKHYIDLYECGIPVTTFLSNKVVWTWGGGFHLLYENLGLQLGNNKVDVYMGSEDLHYHVLHEESAEVAKRVGILDPDKIAECFQYVWARRLVSHIDWEMHASNYWVSDGIIQDQGDTSAWEVGNALKRNIHLDWIMESTTYMADTGVRISSPKDRWVAVTQQALLHDDIVELPPEATSFFLLEDKSDGRRVILPAVMFPHNNRLRVLHLSWCTFSFTSPPFLCCIHLRFLLLDHCTDVRGEEHEGNNQNESCFQKLWVLDLRHTDWYSIFFMCLMDELRELNVEGIKDWRIVDLCGSKASLVKLRVAADPDSTTEIAMQWPTLNMSRAIHLTAVILENCVGLEQVVPDALPPLLESFSFIISDVVIAKISSISFQGLAKLNSVLLRGLMGALEELDLSGTEVKTVDLREMVAVNLKQLILLGCEKLKSIQWPPAGKSTRNLELFHISTIRSASSGQANWEEKSKETSAAIGSSAIPAEKPARSFDWYISTRDARLLRSLAPFKEYFDSGGGCMEMASSSASTDVVGDSECVQGIRQPGHYFYARDVIFQDYLNDVDTNGGAIRWMWAGAPALAVDRFKDWYVHLQDELGMESGLLQQQGSTQGTSTRAALIPKFICNHAKKLHVHDSFSITSIPVPLVNYTSWTYLKWCQVERCPKLSSVFATPTPSDDENWWFHCFSMLTTFWASKLPKVRYIWKWSVSFQPQKSSFQDLEFLHLDYCPRLIHVLPLSTHMTTLPRLQTLEIVCCGDLVEIFPLDPQRQEKQTIINFPELKHINLHDLPKLQLICGKKMLAPKLETIKIRGCWRLRRLPVIGKQCPKVDCEKDWWDNLVFEEGDVNYCPSLYKPVHSRYYKKARLPRGTVLR
ncbi:uncharacterized protein LOC123410466 [Hordeum vulgare subsp. vulgare]|uniref:Disease resistance protein At4g27190-like leucine-rich repeats domain-containing protein n=1 Tax=Hordeum vulgare subsp. vulgare TaxID=112509 RepID=A0A8I6Y9W1_HORVV|nr:uncharacterized protein LOC123410466 [Hordeum vulgare subsp. vulgare]